MLQQKHRGFTTIELMIAVVVIGILGALAYPAFLDQIRKGRRSEGMTALANLQQAQERWRATNAIYATSSQLSSPSGLGLASRTASGYYDLAIAIDSATATGYVASATAVSGTSQAGDGDCATLWVRMEGGNLSYGAGSTVNWADPKRCWAR